MNQSDSLSAIRRRARLDRHATSYPLIVIGAAGFHYASFRSSIGWLPVVYGMPLAFVVVWALQWRTERDRGVGSGHDGMLMLAFTVLLGTSFVMSETWWTVTSVVATLSEVWALLPAGLGLVVLGWRQRNWALVGWAGVIVAGLIAGESAKDSSLVLRGGEFGASYVVLLPQLAFAAATCAGLLQFRREGASG